MNNNIIKIINYIFLYKNIVLVYIINIKLLAFFFLLKTNNNNLK